MKIHLNETELRDAVVTFIESRGFDLSEQDVAINFTAGRGDRGHYADIVLSDGDTPKGSPCGEDAAEEAEAEVIEESPFSEDVVEPDDDEPAIFGD
jgi:hypothetical protein